MEFRRPIVEIRSSLATDVSEASAREGVEMAMTLCN